MATLFHEGRKILRTEIKNNNYADIADFLYFRIQVSKYKDINENTFFLLPNIEYLVKETGISKRTCERALQELVKSDFISKSKIKCYDGAVRIKIFITSKFKKIMASISNLIKKDNTKEIQNNNHINCNQMAESDSVNLAESIIKEDEVLKGNNNIKNIDNSIVKNVKFNLEDEYTYKLVEYLADKYNLDCQDILFALVDLKESNLYNCEIKLIEDAITVVKRNTSGEDILPTGEIFNSYKAIEVAEDERNTVLSAKQQLAINQMLKYLTNKGKATISNIREVFSWIEFQITNPEFQFSGLGFKHCLNIIRNLLCDNSKHQYSKPIGFKPIK